MNPQLLSLVMSRSDHLLNAWIVLGIVGLMLLAIVAAIPAARTNPAVGRVLALGWLLFAITHLMCMHWILKQWAAAAHVLTESGGFKNASEAVRTDVLSVITVPEIVWVLPFHLVFDAFVVIGLWWLTRPPK